MLPEDTEPARDSALERRSLELVDLLPPKEQLAVRYHYLQGLSLRETRRQLGLTREATRLLIGRALWRLRRRTKEEEP
jgi:DNA-directed RNA polymerase specialized sigma24 family protein